MRYILIIFGIAALLLVALPAGNLTPFRVNEAEKELPLPERQTKEIELTDEQIEELEDIEKTVIRLDTDKTIVVGGQTYYLIGKDVGTSVISTRTVDEGGRGVLEEISESVSGYRTLYVPAEDCPTNPPEVDLPCANNSGVSLDGTIYALKRVVNQSLVESDPIHGYNIFDVYYHRPELPPGISEAELLVYRPGVSDLTQIEVDKENNILKVTGHFMTLKKAEGEEEYWLQGRNIPAVSGVVSTFTYLGTLDSVTENKFSGGTGEEVHVYYFEPYLYLSYLSPEELEKKVDEDQKELEEIAGNRNANTKSLQLKALVPSTPTIAFDMYVFSDPDVLRPEFAYIRPQISDLHIAIGECPLVYFYGREGQQFSIGLPEDVVFTMPAAVNRLWDITLESNGAVNIEDAIYPYLFYTQIPRQSPYQEQKEGWIISSIEWDRLRLSQEILPSIGLTEQESNDFATYLLSVTPKHPWYVISVSVRRELDDLHISPLPDTVIVYDVTVQGLDSPERVQQPKLPAIQRKGSTAVILREHVVH